MKIGYFIYGGNFKGLKQPFIFVDKKWKDTIIQHAGYFVKYL